MHNKTPGEKVMKNTLDGRALALFGVKPGVENRLLVHLLAFIRVFRNRPVQKGIEGGTSQGDESVRAYG